MSASPSDIGFGPRFVAPVLSGPALNPVNTTMIAVALVPIAQATGVSASLAIWLVAGLYIVSAVAQPAMGRIADIFGPKKVYVTGLLLVMVGGLVPAVWAFFPGALLSRIIIGLGTSAAYPSAMTLISDQARRLGRHTPRPLLTGLSVSSLVTTAVGPVIGGLLVHQLGWQWIFIVNTPVAAVILLFVLVWLPADNTRESAAGDSGLDIPGMAVFTVMLVSALLFFLDLDAGLNWLIPVAVVALGVLVWRELRVNSPFIDLRMLVGNGALTRTYLRMFITYTGMYLMVYGFTQWLQDAAGYSADHAGLIQLSTTAFALVCSWIVARSTSVRGPLTAAAIALIPGALLMAFVDAGSTLIYLLLLVGVFGITQGFGSVCSQEVVYRSAPKEQMGSASGLSRTAIQIGAIVASSIIGPVFGESATDAGVHTLAWIVLALGLAGTLLTVTDKALKATGTDD
ncbi:MFS transporter [Corynebacterium variabile]|uniref:MFS transporter n=1 Tax=Corynebacterium variabile TaxID=1727 RepID=UPI003FD5B478